MQDHDSILNSFLWSFGLGCVFDVLYLTVHLGHLRNFFLSILGFILLAAFFYWFSHDSKNPWDKLGVFLLIIIGLGIAGCGILIAGTVVASNSLTEFDYDSLSFGQILVFIFHLCPIIIALVNFYFLIMLLRQS